MGPRALEDQPRFLPRFRPPYLSPKQSLTQRLSRESLWAGGKAEDAVWSL